MWGQATFNDCSFWQSFATGPLLFEQSFRRAFGRRETIA
jgi:hypothetical protein